MRFVLWILPSLLLACGPVAPLGADHAVTLDTKTLGVEGGTLSVDGARLNIPAGALTSETRVTLRRASGATLVPAHITPVTPVFEVGPAQVVLGQSPRLELTYDTDATIVVVETGTICDTPTARDPELEGTTIGNGVASFQLAAFGEFLLGTPDPGSCSSSADCPCGEERCETPGVISYCDGKTGECRLSTDCAGDCACPGP